MSTEELRRWLDYPDDDVPPPDLHRIATRAARRRTRRRVVTTGCTLAIGIAAAIGYASVVDGGNRVSTGVPSSGGDHRPVVTSPAPTPTPTARTDMADEPTTQIVRPGQHIDLGHGWSVWITAGGDVCRRSPNGHESDCRSTTDGNIGGLNMQMSGSAAGSFISAVIPYRAARVDIILDGTTHPAELIRFRDLKGWTFYSLWLPGNAANAAIAAYDATGKALTP